MTSPLQSLTTARNARSGRVSSWDQRGRNQDYWVTGPGRSRVLADLEGPGQITHIWMTQWCRQILGPGLLDPFETESTAPVLEIHNALGLNWEVPDPDYYRKVLIKITWDDETEPGVLVPLGDFFGIGHCVPVSYESALFSVSAKPEESLIFGGSAALNSYAPMPFASRAKIELVNEGDLPISQYFMIDYELYREPLRENTLYFHAAWNRNNPCDGWGPDLQTNSPEVNIVDLDAENNYLILQTQGRGHYVGCNLSVYHRQGSWWGEGEDTIFVDDDTWPPSLHGTGTEDYFNHAWGMQDNAYQYHGAILHESKMPGYAVSYRFHVGDPVHFAERIKVSIEHGQGNHLADDWSSTAYWYQTLPSPKARILPLADRLPPRPIMPPIPEPGIPPRAAAGEVAEMRRRRDERMTTYMDKMHRRTANRIERSDTNEAANIATAADLRRRFQ